MKQTVSPMGMRPLLAMAVVAVLALLVWRLADVLLLFGGVILATALRAPWRVRSSVTCAFPRVSVAIQQVEGHVLTPLVQRWGAQLPPVLSIVASVVFGLLFGLVGVLFATPLMVVLMTLVEKLYVERFLEADTVT